MKNVMVALVALTTCTFAAAQNVNTVWQKESSRAEIDHPASYPKALNNIHIKAVRSFKQAYHTESESWFTIRNGYRASFVANSISYAVIYDKKGRWLYTIKQYSEAKMPEELRAQVKTVYYDLNITLVEEVERPMKPLVHVVHMEDATTLVNIRIIDREMETVLDVKKS